MGCVKSKRSDSAAKNANATEKLDGKSKGTTKGEKAYLVHSEMDSTENSPQINPVLLEYAQKLSEEIVARAVQQWVEVDRRYGDIPYIECDVPWDWGRRVAEETSGQARPWHWRFLRVTKQGHLSLKHLHSEWIYLLWAGVWMSCQYISFDLLLDWIILGLILKKKKPFPPKALWSRSRFCDYLYQSLSLAEAERLSVGISTLSDLICHPLSQ